MELILIVILFYQNIEFLMFVLLNIQDHNHFHNHNLELLDICIVFLKLL